MILAIKAVLGDSVWPCMQKKQGQTLNKLGVFLGQTDPNTAKCHKFDTHIKRAIGNTDASIRAHIFCVRDAKEFLAQVLAPLTS